MKLESNESERAVLIELFVLSAMSLFFELLAIRWMSADVRTFTVFRTFPLATCFIGLGLGFALPRDNTFRFLLWALVQFVGTLAYAQISGIAAWIFPSISVYQWQDVAVTATINTFWQHMNLQSLLSITSLFGLMLEMALLLAGPFAVCVCIGSRLAALFGKLKPLPAYSVNIAGAIVGSVSFACMSFLELPPAYLLIPVVAIALYYLIKRFGFQRQFVLCTALLPILVFIIPPHSPELLISQFRPFQDKSVSFWSPYQRIDLTTFKYGDGAARRFMGLELGSNYAFYQYYFPVLPEEIGSTDSEMYKLYQPLVADRDLPYKLGFQCKDVLVVGAGTGQEVSFALKHGAESVDAVEIDPVILRTGKKYNAAYSSPKVHLYHDDARHFFNHCKKKYDLIVFGYLDSHTVTGQNSSVRVDAYIYTKESMQKTLTLLKPKGMIFLYFVSVGPWIQKRLFATLEAAAGYEPLFTQYGGRTILLLGDRVREHSVSLPEPWKLESPPDVSKERVLEDDWPYLYVDTHVVDLAYLLVVGEVLVFAALAGRRLLFGPTKPNDWLMFFMGAAFILIEFHAISFLSLLYGSTWVTAAIVINSILVMILIANFLVIKFNAGIHRYFSLVFLMLFAALAASYFLPAHLDFAGYDSPAASAIMTLITVLPLSMAGIIFAGAFSNVGDSARALAFNLFGAVIGANLEYLSNFFGVRSLVLIGGLVYLCAFACHLLGRNRIESSAVPESA